MKNFIELLHSKASLHKIVDHKNPYLNIIACLTLSPEMIKTKNKLFHTIIANISMKRNDELNLTDDNLKFIFFRLYCLGYDQFKINIISKNILKDLTILNIDINPLLNKVNHDTVLNTKFLVGYFDIKHILDNDFIKHMLNDSTPTVYIFENMSWTEVILYFRSTNYIISGGKVSERHIMDNERYKLAIFLKCINNINKPSDNNSLYPSSSNLLRLYRKNPKTLMKFLKSNVDLTNKLFTDDKINDFINQFYTKYDVSKELNTDILKYKDNKNMIYLLYRKIITASHISDNILDISKKELYLFFSHISNELDLNHININQHILLFEIINNIVYTSSLLSFTCLAYCEIYGAVLRVLRSRRR
jgi:hypothetical protein